MAHRTLIRGGHVVSVDPGVGELPAGDVIVEGDTIVDVRPTDPAGSVPDAELIDATGMIVIPGFVDTHRHTWEAAIRACAPNATLDDYFVEVLDSFAPVYQATDVYASNLVGALECLDAGITTLVDWSHINNTPEHPDAAIQGLQEAGIRGQYAYGSANTSLADYWFNSSITVPESDVERIRSTYFSSDDQLLSMALATRGTGFCTDEVVTAEWQLARRLGIPITVHVGMGRLAGRFAMIDNLDRLGLLGPDTTYIHCCYFSEGEWAKVRDSGGMISIAPQVEVQMGHGWPPVMKSVEYGLSPSLSIDVVTTVPGDMFTQIRAAFGAERARVNAECWQADVGVPDTMLTAADMLRMATLNGAKVAGLDGMVGSLTPGKKADIVLLDATRPNLAGYHDATAAVTLSADVSNVDTVIVGGEIRKRGGRLLADTARARTLVEQARERLRSAVAARRADVTAEPPLDDEYEATAGRSVEEAGQPVSEGP